jgi:CDGSH-type Zn-finger protein/uncharacterized Fe-S cluster protein YjdI
MATHAFHYSGKEIEVTWDQKRCTHAAECLSHLPKVFHLGKEPWVTPDQAAASDVAHTVMRCPTGALHFVRKDGITEPVPEENTLMIQPHGPLYLRGNIEIIDENGTVLLTDTRVALCRCGGSAIKPFCDDRHIGKMFRDRGRLGACPDPQISVPATGKLTIRLTPDGPYQVQGKLEIIATDGQFVRVENPYLCRCGSSADKPFCDGSHSPAGFLSCK